MDLLHKIKERIELKRKRETNPPFQCFRMQIRYDAMGNPSACVL